MTIIDSANLRCDRCGVVKNHHVLYSPSGWLIIQAYNKHYCPDCVEEAHMAIEAALENG